MPILRFKNKDYPQNNIQVLDNLSLVDVSTPSDSKFFSVRRFNSLYYSPNSLVIDILPEPQEDIFELPRFESSFGPLGEGNENYGIHGNAWWQRTNASTVTPEWRKYKRLGGSRYGEARAVAAGRPVLGLNIFKIESMYNRGRSIQISLSEQTNRAVNEAVNQVYLDVNQSSLPAYGFITFGLRMVNSTNESFTKYFMLKYTMNLPSAPPPPQPEPEPEPEPEPVWYESTPLTYETLFVPSLTASFSYNFFEVNETNYDVAQRKNYRGRPLRDIPKYILLEWNSLPQFPRLGSRFAPRRVSKERSARVEELLNLNNEELPRIDEALRDSPQLKVMEENNQTSGQSEIVRVETLFGNNNGQTGGGSFMEGVYFPGADSYETAGGWQLFPSNTRRDAERAFPDEEFRLDIDGPGTTGTSLTLDELFGEEEGLAFAGAFDEESILGQSNDELENIVERYDLLPHEYFSQPIKKEYVGCTITKKRIPADGGVPEVVDVIVIPNKNVTSYVDYKIAYGETYEYSIRSVLKFVNTENLSLYIDTDAILDRNSSIQNFTNYSSNTIIYPGYYFDSQNSNKVLVDALEFVRPDHPINVRVFPNSVKSEIFISWNQKQQNRDVVGFNIYKKTEEGGMFRKLNTELLPLRQNFFIDKDLNIETNYFYAIESVDYHGNISTLSTQYMVSLEPQDVRSPQRCENEVRLYKRSGMELFESQLPKKREKIKFNDSVKFVVNPLFKNTGRDTTFLLKVRSLDTNKEKELKVKFKTRIVNNIRGPRNLETDGKIREGAKNQDVIDDDAGSGILRYFGQKR